MSTDKTGTADVAPAQADAGTGDKGGNSGWTPPATQEELNRVIAERVSRERQKYADYGDLKAKAESFDQIQQQNQTEAEKAAARVAEAEKKAAEAEARATRREIALEKRLSQDDAALLDGMTDEDAMRRLAERLANAASEQEAPVGFRVDHSGRKPGATPNKDDAARAFFGI